MSKEMHCQLSKLGQISRILRRTRGRVVGNTGIIVVFPHVVCRYLLPSSKLDNEMGGLLKNVTMTWVSKRTVGKESLAVKDNSSRDAHHCLSTLARITAHRIVQFSPTDSQYLHAREPTKNSCSALKISLKRLRTGQHM